MADYGSVTPAGGTEGLGYQPRPGSAPAGAYAVRPLGGGQGRGAVPTRRRKRVPAAFATFVILVSFVAVAFTYYFDSVEGITPDKLPTSQVTAIMASDGKTQIAQLGTENRIDIDITRLDERVRHALIAGEDKDFYDHDGISLTGIARAAFNNSTGGERQGGSTITQQYVKLATQRMEMSLARKFREAVLARKLEQTYSKDQILGFYLNTVWFGRNAMGIEKAAQAYFGKPAAKLTYQEAAVLGAVIRTPEPDYLPDGRIDPGGYPGLDPELNPVGARDRWNYVLNNMAEKGWLETRERETAQYPTTLIARAKGTRSAEWGIKGSGTGNVVNYVYAELGKVGLTPNDVRTGGYRITTTINRRIQKIAEATVKNRLKGEPANLMSALVAVDPTTGRVIAYYGGDDGTGHDYAGLNTENGVLTGGHPPGSTMKVYTLAAALDNDISLWSRWDAREIRKVDATHPYKVKNADRTDADVARHCPPGYCPLLTALVQSYNVPFFYITQRLGPDKVIRMAQAAGIRHIWGNDGKAYPLEDHEGDWGRSPFDYQVGYGQYGVTVLEHASGMATFANGGIYNAPHFVLKVEQRQLDGSYRPLSEYSEKLLSVPAISEAVADEVTAAMQQVPPIHDGWALDGGRDVAAKTGTWELASGSRGNAHAWVVGFTRQIATAVWVGNKGEEKALVDKDNDTINSGNMPGDIWHTFLDEASRGMPKLGLPNDLGQVGSADQGNGVRPTPPPSPQPSPSPSGSGGVPCKPPAACPSGTPSAKPEPSVSPAKT